VKVRVRGPNQLYAAYTVDKTQQFRRDVVGGVDWA